MMTIKRFSVLLCAAVLTLSLSGCGKAAGDSTLHVVWFAGGSLDDDAYKGLKNVAENAVESCGFEEIYPNVSVDIVGMDAIAFGSPEYGLVLVRSDSVQTLLEKEYINSYVDLSYSGKLSVIGIEGVSAGLVDWESAGKAPEGELERLAKIAEAFK